MIKRYISRTAALLACMAMLAFGALGCAPSSDDGKSSDPAALNRSYMASINQQMADLDGVLESFQSAVGEGDAVAMQASLVQAGRIIDEVKAAEAPEMLKSVKDGYVSGLDQLQQSLGDYVQLYSDAQAGWLDEAAFNDRLAQVQSAYDSGVQALADADAAAVAVANAGPEGKAESSKAASSQEAPAQEEAAASQADEGSQEQ